MSALASFSFVAIEQKAIIVFYHFYLFGVYGCALLFLQCPQGGR